MNEELLNELSEAMKRRDKATAAIARWQEQKDDAEEDIRELSSRITESVASDPEAPTYGNPEPELFQAERPADAFEPTVWTPEQV